MNRAEISNKILEWAHRTDLGSQVDQFIDNTTDRINLRLGTDYTLNGNNSENTISIDYPNIYIYGGLREMAIYTMNEAAYAGYDALFDKDMNRLNITAESTGFEDDSPVIKSEAEQWV